MTTTTTAARELSNDECGLIMFALEHAADWSAGNDPEHLRELADLIAEHHVILTPYSSTQPTTEGER